MGKLLLYSTSGPYSSSVPWIHASGYLLSKKSEMSRQKNVSFFSLIAPEMLGTGDLRTLWPPSKKDLEQEMKEDE